MGNHTMEMLKQLISQDPFKHHITQPISQKLISILNLTGGDQFGYKIGFNPCCVYPFLVPSMTSTCRKHKSLVISKTASIINKQTVTPIMCLVDDVKSMASHVPFNLHPTNIFTVRYMDYWLGPLWTPRINYWKKQST